MLMDFQDRPCVLSRSGPSGRSIAGRRNSALLATGKKMWKTLPIVTPLGEAQLGPGRFREEDDPVATRAAAGLVLLGRERGVVLDRVEVPGLQLRDLARPGPGVPE